MAERVVFIRALTGAVLHPEVEVVSGDVLRKLSQPGDISFSVPIEWHQWQARDGSYILDERKTLVVVEAANRQIRQVGLVDKLTPGADSLQVSCGGFSMLAGQSGPWEGQQGWYTVKDPVELFAAIWDQVQAYENSDLGIRVTGDSSSGSTVGQTGSARWQSAQQQYRALRPEVERWQARVLEHERVLTQRKERMFKALGLKRIGDVSVSGNRPDDPGVKADSTIWVNENNRTAYRWRSDHDDWIAYSSANDITRAWLDYRRNLDVAKDRLSDAEYALEPAQELLEKYEREAREEYSLYFWQNHDMGDVVEDLMALGPFEFREQAAWVKDEDGNDRLDLQLEVGAPKVGVRRPELHLEFGHNIQGDVAREYGNVYTGIAQFGAGSGSEVLSEQRDWNPEHVVRNILTETDKDAYNRSLVRNAANKTRDRVQAETGLQFVSLTITHDQACPKGSFDVGDELQITGHLQDRTPVDQWVRVLTAKTSIGSDDTVIEVENV